MFYAVDRLEDQQAVLQDDEAVAHVVDKELLPKDVRAGDVLVLREGRYVQDQEETQRRRERIRRLELLLQSGGKQKKGKNSI